MTKEVEQLPRHFETKPCQQNDFDAVFRLLRQLWPDKDLDTAALQKVYERGLRGNSQIYLCASNANDVVGFASLTIKNNLWQAANVGHIDELMLTKNIVVVDWELSSWRTLFRTPGNEAAPESNWIQRFIAQRRINFTNDTGLRIEGISFQNR